MANERSKTRCVAFPSVVFTAFEPPVAVTEATIAAIASRIAENLIKPYLLKIFLIIMVFDLLKKVKNVLILYNTLRGLQ